MAMKPVYLLAGGRGGGNMDPILDAIFDDIGHNSPNIAYIGAANGDDPGFFERMVAVLRNGRRCKVTMAPTCSGDADPENVVDIITSADAIFVAGGDVEEGMNVLEERDITGMLPNLYHQGILFFGISAGSIMLAKEWVRWSDPNDDSTAELFPCLDVAPVLCDTHGESDNWTELKAALDLSPYGTVGYGITSGTCLKVYADASVEALAGKISRYVRQVNSVKKEDHLAP